MPYECSVRRLAAQPALSVRRRVEHQEELGRVIPESFLAVAKELSRCGLHAAGETYVRYLELGAGTVELEVGFTVREAACAPRPPVQRSELPAGEGAVTLHRGPYERLPEAMAALQEWMRAHGHEPVGPFWEVYLNGPPEVTDPALFETELVVPVRS